MSDKDKNPDFDGEGKIRAPKVLLLGEMGAGKTTAARSLVECGFETFVLALEPGWGDILGDIPSEKLKVHYVDCFGGGENTKGSGHSFDRILDAATLLNNNSYDAIIKMGGVNKAQHQQFFDIVSACNKFVDERTGVSYGDMAEWDHTRAIVVDGMFGLNEAAKRVTVGDKPFLELRDYTAIQFLVQQLVTGLCSKTRAMVVLTSHLEIENDPNSGVKSLMVSTVGKALAPVLPKPFSDVIYAKKQIISAQAKWTWNTLSAEVQTKSRNLPLREGLEPNFKQLVANWKKRVGLEK